MTVFKIKYENCSFYEDSFNCARCYVVSRKLYEECKQAKYKQLFCKEFADLMKEIDPYPWSDIELEAKKEDNMNISKKFTKFVELFWEAYDWLYKLKQK
jgi:hypothetical protein